METFRQSRQRERVNKRKRLLKIAHRVGYILGGKPDEPIAIINLSGPLGRKSRNSSNYSGTNEIDRIFLGFIQPGSCDNPELDQDLQLKLHFEPGWSLYVRSRTNWDIIMERNRPTVVQLPIEKIVPHNESSVELTAPRFGGHILCITGVEPIEDWIFDPDKNKGFCEASLYEGLTFLSQEMAVTRAVMSNSTQ